MTLYYAYELSNDIKFPRGACRDFRFNLTFVKRVPSLFCKNERVVFEIKPHFGGRMWVVMVAALNVGRIRLAHEPSFLTNLKPFSLPDQQPSINNVEIDIGEELGTFLLGSTAVVVFDKKASDQLSFENTQESSKIKLGQPLASIRSEK